MNEPIYMSGQMAGPIGAICDCGKPVVFGITNGTVHCWIHHTDEPVTTGTYIVCGECFHAYQTVDELMAVEADKFGDDAQTDPERMWSCPYCIHDF